MPPRARRFIAAVGVSRVYLGAHFPTDVIGGWILGAIWLFGIVQAIPSSL